MRILKFHYSIVIVAIIAILLAVIAWVIVLSTARQTPQANVTTPSTPLVTARRVATGFNDPTDIVSTPGDDHLYITEQAGTIRRVTPGKSDSQLVVDLTSKVFADGEMGLLGLAFHPQYAQNGFLFVNYIDKNKNTVIARYHATNDVVDVNSEKIILQVEQPYSNHNGGDLVFGPNDGYLYAALGDGGQAGDPDDRAQNKNDLLGKILRLDIDTNEPYIVPSDNPFISQEGVRPEIWAYGLRNPWRISFDKQTNDLYIADVGQGSIEEVNVQPANSNGGENYGWRCYEGTHEYNLKGCEGVNNFVAPIAQYSHDEGRCSITGGYAYRGKAQPSLRGKYFYGDFCGGQLYYAEQNNDSWQATLALETEFAISTFGESNDGELYFADYDNGDIYRIDEAIAIER